MGQLNWEKNFKDKFHDSWHKKMQPIIESEEVWEIYQKLKEVKSRGRRSVPDSSSTFRAFGEMNLSNLKVVWVLQDPYPGIYPNGMSHATGIAMDNENSPDGRLQPSLVKFYNAIQKAYGEEVEYDKSLLYLQHQGVMLLNSDLTCEAYRTGSHEGWWKPFMKRVFIEILGDINGLVYVFSGKSSQKLAQYVNEDSNYIFETEHPAAASYANREWNSLDVFKDINTIIRKNNGEAYEIYWNEKELNKLILELPF